ncbi:MAG: hypothetical protein J6R47_05000 [Acholeplasmatales bacterium]|nr:hypothetical protein [Acholeplasmatales bacterium]
MEIINQTVEYALSDLFMTWWYIIAITSVCTPLIVGCIYDNLHNYETNWLKKCLILCAIFFITCAVMLFVANFTCATLTGYYEYTAIFNDIHTQKEVFSTAKDIEYVDGIYKFKSMVDYGGLK